MLTLRKDPQTWYRSLCKMAVRMGPLSDFEKHIYGFAMPQGRQREHLEFYERHNREVAEYFADRPDKLIAICWDEGDPFQRLAEFLNQPADGYSPPQLNQSLPVYGGDKLFLAHVNRVMFQSRWWCKRQIRRVKSIPRRILRGRKAS